MADDTTNPKAPEAPTPEEKAAQLEAARKVLIDAGAQVFTPQDMHGFKAKLTSPLEARLADREAELAAIKAEREALAHEKAERDNAGKSRAELIEAQLKAAQDAIKAKEAEIAAERTERAAVTEKYRAERRDARIQAILADPTTPTPTDTEAALLKAKANLSALSLTEDGELKWTEPTGVEHTGQAAELIVKEWWSKQTGLHSAAPAGPPTKGAPHPAPPKPDVYVSDPSEPLEVRLEKAKAWKARQAQQARS